MVASLESSKRLDSIITLGNVVPYGGRTDFKTLRVLWDTGANFGGVSPELIREWDIKPDGFSEIEIADGKKTLQPYYNMLVRFQDGPPFRFKASPVPSKRFDVLVGMDIIAQGAFLIEPIGDGTRFTFSI